MTNSPPFARGGGGGNKHRHGPTHAKPTGTLEESLLEREDPGCYPPSPPLRRGEKMPLPSIHIWLCCRIARLDLGAELQKGAIIPIQCLAGLAPTPKNSGTDASTDDNRAKWATAEGRLPEAGSAAAAAERGAFGGPLI